MPALILQMEKGHGNMPTPKRESSLAIVVAVENYRYNRNGGVINSVDYALNDAELFRTLMINEFDLPESKVILFAEENASLSALQNELPYLIGQLSPTSKFYFFYAGHGFFKDGANRITAWDSHPMNLIGTTISIQDILTTPLHKSGCEQNLIFIDACARRLMDNITGRDLISTMSPEQFDNFVKSTPHTAMFFSCSPGEASYSSQTLKHGIWTWHLIQAIRGEIKGALVRDCYVTDSSLRDYLSSAVPTYIRENTTIRGTQNPTAIISSSNTFEIKKINIIKPVPDVKFPNVKFKFNDYFLRNLEIENINQLDNFDKRKKHFVPVSHSIHAEGFVKRLLDDKIISEIDEVYENIKGKLRLRRNEIQKTTDTGGADIDTEYFRYSVWAGQNPDDCSQSAITRILVLRVMPDNLPFNIDEIFPNYFDEIVVPISGKVDFDSLVESFEALQDKRGGKLIEKDGLNLVAYHVEDGSISFTFKLNSNELIIRPQGNNDILALIQLAGDGIWQIIGVEPKLIPEQ